MSAHPFCLAKVKGKKQGEFKGESEFEKNCIELYSVSHGVTAPITRAGSKVTNGPIDIGDLTITKTFGASSIQFAQALGESEVLESVVLTFLRATPEGETEKWFSIELKNAAVTSVNYGASGGDEHVLETITLSVENIKWENMADKMSVDLSWTA